MDFLNYLSNISLWLVFFFFAALFVITIPVAGLFYSSARAFLNARPSFARIFLNTFVVIGVLAVAVVDLNFQKNIRGMHRYGATKKSYFVEQVRRLNKAIKTNPQDASNYFSRGKIYADHLRYNQAIRDFEKALTLNPRLPMADNYLGFIYLAKGRDAKAEEHLMRSIEQSPNFSKPYFNLALLYHRRKDDVQAIQWISKAIECDRNFTEAYALRAGFYVGRKEYVKALEDLRQVKRLNPLQSARVDSQIKWIQDRMGTVA